MLKMVDGTGIIGVDMVCPLGGAVSPPQPPNYDNVEMEGVRSLMLPNSLKAPLERVELFGNSTQGENPMPDNPQEIKSAGRKSKNLFNKNTAKQGYEFPSAGSDVEALKEGWFVSDFMPVKATTYYISGKATGNGCKLYNKDKVFVKNMQASFGNIKFDEGIAYFRINGEIKDLDKIQVEERIVATDYEPYGYLLDVKVTGKNLLSNKPTDWQIGKRISWSGYPEGAITIYPVAKNAVNVISLKPSTTYSIINNSGGIVINRIVERGSSENGIKDHDVRSSKYTFVTNQNTMNAILQFEKVDGTELLSTDIEFIKIMLVEGEVNEPTPYEPYTEQTLTLTSDRPLTKWDKLVEQGGEYGIMYNSKHMFLNGSEDWVKSSIDNVFYLKSFEGLPNSYEIFCDKLKNFRASVNGIELNCILGNRTNLYICIDGIADIGTLKTWLFENNLEVYYNSKESQFVPLSQEEQTQLRNLHSYNGTTNIMVDSGEVECGIKLTYRKEI